MRAVNLVNGRAHRRGLSRKGRLVFSICAFLGAAVIFVLSQARISPASPVVGNWMFLILCSLLACVLLAPMAYLAGKRSLDLFHPLVYPVVFYLFPVFVIGSLTLAFSSNPSWILSLISEPAHYLNLALVYIIIGYIGLVAGFSLSLGGRLGSVLSRITPDWRWAPAAARVPGLLLFALGTVITLYGYSVGVVGYQVRDDPLLSGGALSSFTLLGTLGSFILWHSFFRRDRNRRELWTPILALLVGQILLNAVLSGSRFSLLSGGITILAAYRFAGGRFSARLLVPVIVATTLAILIGFSLGTTFRAVKGSEEVVPLEETLGVAGTTITEMAIIGSGGAFDLAMDVVGKRIENLSSFAVIVSNYERLRPLEEQFGIAGNIWTYTWTAMIPRFMWPDKPLISDARAVGALYFGVSTNSFAMTVFGDLLRNFGPIGIPLGMLLLGFLLRILWSALITQSNVSAWRAATYYLLLTGVNYESFYGTVIPGWVRIAFVCLLGGLFANALINPGGRSPRHTTPAVARLGPASPSVDSGD